MTYLKLEDTTVLAFDLSKKRYEILAPNLLPFSLRGGLQADAGVQGERLLNIWFNNQELLSSFFHNRSLSVKRENAKYIMNQLGIKQNNDFESRYKAMVLCKALSVADNYWITNSESEKWRDVNLKNNPLHETLQQIALFGRSLSITGKLRSPELTGQGAYAKAWYREGGELFLFKASSPGGDESKREVSASEVLDCFNIPHVKYDLAVKDGKLCCKCKNMNLDNSSLVDSSDFELWTARQNLDFFSSVKKIDPEMFYKTIVADYLLANSDRHSGNWGFYMNNRTGKIVRMHPLFDHNNAFDAEFMADPNGGACQLMPGFSQRDAALYAIKRCDVRCLKPVSREIFLTKAMYECFVRRASELGLYQKKERNVLYKIFGGGKTDFFPVEIKPDNSSEYWDSVRAGLRRPTASLEEAPKKNDKSAELESVPRKKAPPPQKKRRTSRGGFGRDL